MRGILIVEHITEGLELLQEGTKDGQKDFYIRGPFMQYETKNRNNRVYPKDILIREVRRYNDEYVKSDRALGELGHPNGPTINLPLVSHKITELFDNGSVIMGKAKILDTPNGNIVKSLMREGVKLGVSSRGIGSLKQNETVDYVQEDFYLATPADIVADPSAPAAFVQNVMEKTEWVFDQDTGSWIIGGKIAPVIKKIEESTRTFDKQKREQSLLEAFETYIRNI